MDRQEALDDPSTATHSKYIPECMPDGRYKRVQCYKSVGKFIVVTPRGLQT